MGGGGGRVLPYISHIGMCHPKGGVYFAHFGLESEFPGVVPHPPEQVTGWYTILLSLSSETQFLNNDNTVCIVSNLSTLIERF